MLYKRGVGHIRFVVRKLDRKFSLLQQEYIGSTPGSTKVMFESITHARKQVKDLDSSNVGNRKMSEMHSPRLVTTACSLTFSEMHWWERSPGVGKVAKIKRGKPKKILKSNHLENYLETVHHQLQGTTLSCYCSPHSKLILIWVQTKLEQDEKMPFVWANHGGGHRLVLGRHVGWNFGLNLIG